MGRIGSSAGHFSINSQPHEKHVSLKMDVTLLWFIGMLLKAPQQLKNWWNHTNIDLKEGKKTVHKVCAASEYESEYESALNPWTAVGPSRATMGLRELIYWSDSDRSHAAVPGVSVILGHMLDGDLLSCFFLIKSIVEAIKVFLQRNVIFQQKLLQRQGPGSTAKWSSEQVKIPCGAQTCVIQRRFLVGKLRVSTYGK